jgi:hypothetical protein
LSLNRFAVAARVRGPHPLCHPTPTDNFALAQRFCISNIHLQSQSRLLRRSSHCKHFECRCQLRIHRHALVIARRSVRPRRHGVHAVYIYQIEPILRAEAVVPLFSRSLIASNTLAKRQPVAYQQVGLDQPRKAIDRSVESSVERLERRRRAAALLPIAASAFPTSVSPSFPFAAMPAQSTRCGVVGRAALLR